jgi:hypothetical protein
MRRDGHHLQRDPAFRNAGHGFPDTREGSRSVAGVLAGVSGDSASVAEDIASARRDFLLCAGDSASVQGDSSSVAEDSGCVAAGSISIPDVCRSAPGGSDGGAGDVRGVPQEAVGCNGDGGSFVQGLLASRHRMEWVRHMDPYAPLAGAGT